MSDKFLRACRRIARKCGNLSYQLSPLTVLNKIPQYTHGCGSTRYKLPKSLSPIVESHAKFFIFSASHERKQVQALGVITELVRALLAPRKCREEKHTDRDSWLYALYSVKSFLSQTKKNSPLKPLSKENFPRRSIRNYKQFRVNQFNTVDILTYLLAYQGETEYISVMIVYCVQLTVLRVKKDIT